MEPNVMTALVGYAPIVLIFGVFYFLVLRPQGEAAKAHAAMVEGLKRGDNVLMVSGLMARVEYVDPASVKLRINHEDTVLMARTSVERVLTDSEAKLLDAQLANVAVKKK